MAQIVDAVDDRTPAERKRLFDAYRPGTRDIAHDMWNHFSRGIYDHLDNLTLDSFVSKDNAHAVSAPRLRSLKANHLPAEQRLAS